MKSDIGKYIFTEDLDYSQTPTASIWGDGDPDTLNVLHKLVLENKLFGKWLHFAAGDGRYNNLLLNEVDKMIATDVDENALKKLQRITPANLSSKLSVRAQNITQPFPFVNNEFEGVFNTGTLHLFPPKIVESVISETQRIVKPEGLFFFDFATDVKRIKDDGTLIGRSICEYSKLDAKNMLLKIIEKREFEAQFIECSVPPEKVTSGDGTYTFSCNYWIVIAKKKSQ